MTEATGLLPGCKQCGKSLARKSRGPAPAYCSATCRARAKDARAKSDGRYESVKAALRAEAAAARQANARPCLYCGDPMTNPRRVQCGKPECERLFKNQRQAEFQQKHKTETGRYYSKTYVYERTCILCGTVWTTGNAKAKYCSNTCQAAYEHGPDRIPKKGRQAYRKRQQLLRRLAKAARGTHGTRPFVAGPCASCGTLLVTRRLDIRWCSKKCKLRQKASRRRAAKREAFVEDVSPRRIFERDRWRCRLCGKKVNPDRVVPHPKAPVLDHIIPLAKRGTHEAANMQCAHFLCNSVKSDRGGGEQLLLIG